MTTKVVEHLALHVRDLVRAVEKHLVQVGTALQLSTPTNAAVTLTEKAVCIRREQEG
jgi:hypothetical protein